MYHQVRASSSCSAPPDLLLVSERDNNIQLRSPVVNIITTPPGNASVGGSGKQPQQHHHQPLPHQHQHHSRHQSGNPQDVSSGGSHSKHLRISSSSNGKHGKYSNMHQQQTLPHQDEDAVDAAAGMQQSHGGHAHSRHLHHHKEERIRLEVSPPPNISHYSQLPAKYSSKLYLNFECQHFISINICFYSSFRFQFSSIC